MNPNTALKLLSNTQLSKDELFKLMYAVEDYETYTSYMAHMKKKTIDALVERITA